MKLRGHWLHHLDRGVAIYRAGGITHACVSLETNANGEQTWRAWSSHLDGVTHHATPKLAKAHAMRQLRRLCSQIAPLLP